VVHSLNSGGAQRRLVSLANAFAAAGREVDLVALRGGGEIHHLLDERVRVTVLASKPKPVWMPWFFDGWVPLRRWVRAHRPDVVLAGITTVHAAAAMAVREIDRPPHLVLRASRHPVRRYPWSRPLKRALEPLARRVRAPIYRRADLVLAVSRETAHAVAGQCIAPERCLVLPNPVLTSAFVADVRSKRLVTLPADVPLVLAIGRLSYQKRFDLLLEAFAKVRRETEAQLVILGEGRLRQRLERKARKLGLTGSVTMPGEVDDVADWLARADVLVSTSAFEGSPAAIIEALAAGVPVVASRCPGGSAELLEQWPCGMLVPPGDPAATAEAVLDILRQRRSRAPAEESFDEYTVDASARAYLEQLDRLAAGQSSESLLDRAA
jgi:glycosyltransferase involved in cell wall biosynthesis